MDDYSSAPNYVDPLSTDWLTQEHYSSLMASVSELEPSFEMGTPTYAAGSLDPFAPTVSGDYMLNANVPSDVSLTAAAAHAAAPRIPGRLYCNHPGCVNSNGFQRQSDLKRHQQKHDKLHACSDSGCDKRFGSKADMERHRREVHGKNSDNGKAQLYYCPVTTCKRHQRGFPRCWNMQEHFKKMHGGPMPSPSSSPAVCSMDTPRFSSGESAPNTPPTDMDEPTSPCPAVSMSSQSGNVVRDLLVTKLRELDAKMQADGRYANQIRAELRKMNEQAN